MRGNQSIHELRRMGKKPTHVFVYLLAEGGPMEIGLDPEELLENGLLPEVRIAAKERIDSLDFRFLYGVTVHLQAECKDRLRSAYAEIIRCKPMRVISSGAGVFHDTGLLK